MGPSVAISLDCELRWGVLERVRDDFHAYRENLEGVPDAVHRTLDLFDAHDVRATWAIVGGLACHGWDEWHERLPAWPAYERTALRWDERYRGGPSDERLYFAPGLVEEVRARGHELGSHSFTHLYMNEPGVTPDDVRADCSAVSRLFADRWGTAPASYVFPRNQENHVDTLRAAGITQWRSNPESWYWDTGRPTTLVTRCLRAVDGFSPWPPRGVRVARGAQRASHFVRLGLPNTAWAIHRKRIVRDAAHLRDGEVLHLWWHPHNMGAKPADTAARLDDLLTELTSLPTAPTFRPMAEVALLA